MVGVQNVPFVTMFVLTLPLLDTLLLELTIPIIPAAMAINQPSSNPKPCHACCQLMDIHMQLWQP